MVLNITAGPTCDQSLVALANALQAAFVGFGVDQGGYASATVMCELDGDVLVLNSGATHTCIVDFGTHPSTGVASHINMPGALLDAWRVALGLTWPLPGSQAYPIRLGSVNYTITIEDGVTGASDHVYWLTATEVVATSSSDPYVQPLLG